LVMPGQTTRANKPLQKTVQALEIRIRFSEFSHNFKEKSFRFSGYRRKWSFERAERNSIEFSFRHFWTRSSTIAFSDGLSPVYKDSDFVCAPRVKSSRISLVVSQSVEWTRTSFLTRSRHR
jgi:hypothetical protein